MTEEAAPIDIVMVVLRKWVTIVVCMVLGIAAGVAHAMLSAPWYSATLTVVPSQRSQDSAAMSIAAKLPVGLDSFSTDVQRIQAVLQSTSVRDAVIQKFDLGKLYG